MVKQIFKNGVQNGSKLLFSKQKTILSGAMVIGIMLLASALLGLVKKRLYASIISPGPELDVFFASFRLPDLMFQLLIGGSLNAAFIPVFSHVISRHDRKHTWLFASSIMNIVLILFVALACVFFIFSPWLARIIGLGFNEEQINLLVKLMRILLLSPILLGLSGIATGILQSFSHFLISFFSPVIYNLGAIFGVIVLYPLMGIEGVAWGVVIGSLAHFLIQLPALRHVDFKYSLILDWKNSLIRKVVKLSLPRMVGVGFEQFQTLVLISLASFLPSGSISSFDLGQSLTIMPMMILGLSIAQASLPQFSLLYAKNDIKTLKSTFRSSFNQIFFLLMPITVILVVLKIPAVRLTYGAGLFSWDDTRITAWVVAILSIGFFLQALSTLMIRLLYAVHETRVSVLVSVASIGVSLVTAMGAVWMVPSLGVKAVALGLTIGSGFEFLSLFILLVQRNLIDIQRFVSTPLRVIISGLVMAVLIYLPVKVLDQEFIDTTRVVNLGILVWLVVSGSLTVYLLMTWILGVKELGVVFRVLLKMKNISKSLERSLRTTLPGQSTSATIGLPDTPDY
jgi:putative peptidoglycan lipid II flippase